MIPRLNASTGGPRLSDRTRDRVVGEVAALYDIKPSDILGREISRRFSHPRQLVMWRLRHLGYSLKEIGRGLDRDHATVVFGIRQHDARVAAEMREAA